jgi:FixJ family two-component response regulator
VRYILLDKNAARLVESMEFAASRFTRPKQFMEMIEERILPVLLILDIVVREMDAIKIIDWMGKMKFLFP